MRARVTSVPPGAGAERVNRRQVAVGIRIHQELSKRIDRVRAIPRWGGHETLKRALRTDAISGIRGIAGVRDLARNSVGFVLTPRVNAAGTIDEPTDRAALVAEADAVMNGTWDIYGFAYRPIAIAPEWRTHPRSRVSTSLEHFSRLYYTGNELGGDVKEIWELNRHKELLRLAQAYHLTADERYAERVCLLIADWIETNPQGCGVNWLSALEVSFRSIVWCWIWQLTRESNAWSDEAVGKFLWTLSAAARYLERFDSIHHSPNTHLTGEALGLIYIGSCFPVLRDATRWTRRGVDILRSEVPHQFLSDGFHYERASGYHRYNLEFYLHALALAQGIGASWAETFREPVARALRASVAMRMPNGDWPVLGDEDGGSAVPLWAGSSRSQEPLLELGAWLVEPNLARSLRRPTTCCLSWWFGRREPFGVAGDAPARTAVSLSAAGYFLAFDESTSPPWYCLVDAGPHGGNRTGHAHTDLGHIEVAIGNQSVVRDPGCAVYASDNERRDWYRSAAAHATLAVDGDGLAEPSGPFGWRRIAPTPSVLVNDSPDRWTCRLTYPVAGAAASHQREVILIRNGGGVVVVDCVRAEGHHRLEWTWPLGMPIPLTTSMTTPCRIALPNSTLAIDAGTHNALVTARRARYSSTYGHEEAAVSLHVAVETSQWPVIVVTTIAPASAPAYVIERRGETVTVQLDAHRVLRCDTSGGVAAIQSEARTGHSATVETGAQV